MQFIVTSQHRYWWPIKVRLPNPDPRRAGQVIEQGFKAQFRSIPTDEARAIMDEVEALQGTDREARQHELLRSVVIDWDSDVVDEDRQPVPFSVEAFAGLLTNVWALAAFYRAWAESMTGDGARRGN